jgi:hypothetical protein
MKINYIIHTCLLNNSPFLGCFGFTERGQIALFWRCLWVGFVCWQAKANVCNVGH